MGHADLAYLAAAAQKGDADALAVLEGAPRIDVDAEPTARAWSLLRGCKPSAAHPLDAVQVVAYLDAARIMDPGLRLEYLEVLTDLDAYWRSLLAMRA